MEGDRQNCGGLVEEAVATWTVRLTKVTVGSGGSGDRRWSKKKSKVRPGDPDPVAMDSVERSEEGLVADGSGTAVEGSMTTMESVEGLVAGVETPAMVPSDALPEPSGDGSTNPTMIELADPVDSGHATPTAMVADESLDTATVEHPPGGHVAQRRSYLDSVVGTGSNTAPFLIADPQEGNLPDKPSTCCPCSDGASE
nr:hypothetical protein Iba_chr02eCG4200 [Ipomoea batatas]